MDLQLNLKGLLELSLYFCLGRSIEVDPIEGAQFVLLDLQEDDQSVLAARNKQLVARIDFQASDRSSVGVLNDVYELKFVPEVEMSFFAASHQVAIELPDADVPSARL